MQCQCGRNVEIKSKSQCRRCYLADYRRINGRKDLGTRKALYSRQYMTREEAAMTFEEIGAELGCSKAAAQMAYNSAIRKMRLKPQTLKLLRGLIQEKQRVTAGASQ